MSWVYPAVCHEKTIMLCYSFIGVDPLKDVETHGKKLKVSMDRGNFHNISLGQGQEVVAEAAMDMAAKEGHWVILQVRISCIFDVTRSLFSDTNK